MPNQNVLSNIMHGYAEKPKTYYSSISLEKVCPEQVSKSDSKDWILDWIPFCRTNVIQIPRHATFEDWKIGMTKHKTSNEVTDSFG